MKKDVIGNDAFAQEALRVHNLNHPNVIRLLATCLTTSPSMLIFEFMHVGDLKSFLRNAVNGTGLNHVLLYVLFVVILFSDIGLPHLMSITQHVSAGFVYLQECRYLHRDLAARNVLLNAQYVAKIGDFGLLLLG